MLNQYKNFNKVVNSQFRSFLDCHDKFCYIDLKEQSWYRVVLTSFYIEWGWGL